MAMTKSVVLRTLDIRSTQLAEILGVTRGAIAQWGDDDPLPLLRQIQLVQRYPSLFQVDQEAIVNKPKNSRRVAA